MATVNTTSSPREDNNEIQRHVDQNIRLVCVDITIDDNEPDSKHTLEQLRTVVNDVILFQNIADCVQYLNEIQLEKALVITSGSLGQDLVQQVHTMAQVDGIYIFCDNIAQHTAWTEKWSKVRGVYDSIKSMCESLQQAVQQFDEKLTPISSVQFNEEEEYDADLNRLEPAFMYTQLFKKILLDIEYEDQAREALVKICREKYAGDLSELKVIEEFRQDYRPDKAIWWYTRGCFISQMLDQALRCLEGDIIVNMGFLIHDLHRQLEQAYEEQLCRCYGASFQLYCGQDLSIEAFDHLKKTQGGLMAFNSFLSTSRKRAAPFEFARDPTTKENTVGILFMMTIEPNTATMPFANVQEYSYFENEGEVLFSMHTVFRIGNIREVQEKDHRFYEVQLSLTRDDDFELRELTDQIEAEIGDGSGWQRLGRLLLHVEQLESAEKLYLTLLEQKPVERDLGLYYHQLGLIKNGQGEYKEAIRYYEQAISIEEKIHSPTDSHLAISYGNIGGVYKNMGECSKALFYYEKALDIQQKALPDNHPSLATSYSNIGMVYVDMGEYAKALSYYEKNLAISQASLPANHPNLATSYNKIGKVYDSMGDYSKALSYNEKALDIQQKTLPTNHPDLGLTYFDIGSVYDSMGEYSKALSYYEKALNISENTLSANHPDLATNYNNSGGVYDSMGEYSKALSYYEKALDIYQKTLPVNHSSTATCYNNIGEVYDSMQEYSKALFYYEKALDILQKALPADHPHLAVSHSNIGVTYYHIQDYPKALSFLEEALAISQRSLPPAHPQIQTILNWIEKVKKNV